jgi:hypothetical protein
VNPEHGHHGRKPRIPIVAGTPGPIVLSSRNVLSYTDVAAACKRHPRVHEQFGHWFVEKDVASIQRERQGKLGFELGNARVEMSLHPILVFKAIFSMSKNMMQARGT